MRKMNQKDLESKLKEKIEFMNDEMRSFGRTEIQRRYSNMNDLRIPFSDFLSILTYNNFSDRKKGNAISVKKQLELVENGIWPKYSIAGRFDDPEIKRYDYAGTGFTIYLSTNFGLVDYYWDSSSSKVSKYVINPNSLLFLREEGITNKLWTKIVSENKSLKDFCLKPINPIKRDKIYNLAKKFKELSCKEVKYESLSIAHTNFSAY